MPLSNDITIFTLPTLDLKDILFNNTCKGHVPKPTSFLRAIHHCHWWMVLAPKFGSSSSTSWHTRRFWNIKLLSSDICWDYRNRITRKKNRLQTNVFISYGNHPLVPNRSPFLVQMVIRSSLHGSLCVTAAPPVPPLLSSWPWPSARRSSEESTGAATWRPCRTRRRWAAEGQWGWGLGDLEVGHPETWLRGFGIMDCSWLLLCFGWKKVMRKDAWWWGTVDECW